MTDFGAPAQVVKSIYEFTPEALEELAQWLEQRGMRVPVSQLVGFQQLQFAQNSVTGTATTTSSTTYVDLYSGTVKITKLPPGRYLLGINFRMKVSANTRTAYAAIAFNGTVPLSDDQYGVLETQRTDYGHEGVFYVADLTADRTDLTPQFKVDNAAATGTFHYGAILATRLAK